MLFRGRIIYSHNSFYSYLIWPLVELKRGFQAVYNWIIKIIWSELIQGEKHENWIIVVVAFSIFCLLSLFFYYAQNYTNYVIVFSLIIWLIDYQLAKYQYLANKTYTITTTFLDSKSDWVIWQITNPAGKTSREKFKQGKISQITIFRYNILGGAFHEVMGTTWRVHISLSDLSEFLIYEEDSTTEAVKKAKQLANYFDVPLRFAFSEASSNYVDDFLKQGNLNYKKSSSESIKLIITPNQWKIYSKWNLASLGILLGEILKQSSFFLFLLIMASAMIHFGAFLNLFIEPLLAREDSSLTLNLSFSSILSFFRPERSWKTITQLSIAISIMIYQGWQISKEKRVYIDKNNLNVFAGKKKLGQLSMNELEFVVFVKQPLPAILLIDRNSAVEINNLQDEDEFRALLLRIESGVKHYQQLCSSDHESH